MTLACSVVVDGVVVDDVVGRVLLGYPNGRGGDTAEAGDRGEGVTTVVRGDVCAGNVVSISVIEFSDNFTVSVGGWWVVLIVGLVISG